MLLVVLITYTIIYHKFSQFAIIHFINSTIIIIVCLLFSIDTKLCYQIYVMKSLLCPCFENMLLNCDFSYVVSVIF